ncbi:MAG: acetyl-CoA C-acyltransferase [Chloroflexota bacterium]|nr:MAG: acetyl-CoA C-acyltransferase [Chloroflexota bacterium]
MTREVVVIGAARTAIGTFGKSLRDVPPTVLGTAAIKAAIQRAGIKPEDVDQVVVGHVIPTAPEDMYSGRVSAVKAGIPVEVPAMNVNRLCGSGLQAIAIASEMIRCGDAEVAVAGGIESMSRSPYWLSSARWGARMNDDRMIDAMVAALTDPFDRIHMGITAENVAEKLGISREEQDAFAVTSHQRAVEAIEKGYFTSQIAPVSIKVAGKKEPVEFVRDEHVRPDASLESMAKLKPAFKPDGTVTAGNASGINDAAAAVVLMSQERADSLGLRPMATMVNWAVAGVDPKYMGLGPVYSTRKLLDRTGISLDEIDVIELNEAFAAQSLGCLKMLELGMERVNVNGGAVALGHPLGASGVIVTVKLLYEMERRDAKLGLSSLCIGGGQGISAVFRR